MSIYYDIDELYFDEYEEMDIPFGNEFEAVQNTLTHKTAEVISKDPRLNKLARLILDDGIKVEASDIQIKLEKDYGIVRYRIGTEMIPYRKLHPASVEPLTTVFKSFCGLELDKHKIDHRGSFTHIYQGESYDLRVAFMPTTRKEIVSIRLLYSSNALNNVSNLGFPQIVLNSVKHVLNLQEGLILVTGATGSGKTTTMVTALNDIQRRNDGRKNIITIENPPEYVMEDVTQVAVDIFNGLTEARALRAILMQNPDVIMVGEINNEETASTAVRASTSGHLVLATVHANSVLSVGSALNHYGVSAYDLTWALQLVLNQTLTRKLCPHCKQFKLIHPDDWRWVENNLVGSVELTKVYHANPEGCANCKNTGYLGRVMVVGMLDANNEYKKLSLQEGMTLVRLEEELLKNERAVYYPLSRDVFRHLQAGTIDMITARELVR